MASTQPETVLVVGATGNIGISAILAILNSGRHVLAVVRNEASAQKIYDNIGSKKNITTVEADILAQDGVAGVVEQVRAGKLPAFQHVYASAGGFYPDIPLTKVTPKMYLENMQVNTDSNVFAYLATINHLLEQNNPNSTWTLVTGAQGDIGQRAAPTISQGALYSLAVAAAHETEKTNIRFNEIYLALRVETDSVAEQHGTTKSSDFAKPYELLLTQKELKGTRVHVTGADDLDKLRYSPKVKPVV